MIADALKILGEKQNSKKLIMAEGVFNIISDLEKTVNQSRLLGY